MGKWACYSVCVFLNLCIIKLIVFINASFIMTHMHSKDHEEVGIAHQIVPQNQPQFSQMAMGQYWLSKTKLSD